MWLTVSSWLAASAAVECTNSSLNVMGVEGIAEEDEAFVCVAVRGFARIDIMIAATLALLYIRDVFDWCLVATMVCTTAIQRIW